MAVPNIAPNPDFPERSAQFWERKFSPATPGSRGPLRFQEGIGSDTDVPNDFVTGVRQGTGSAPGRPNRNANVFEKYPDETMRQRAHVGSAAWVEAPTFLGEFAHATFFDYAEPRIEQVDRSGGGDVLGRRHERINPTVVQD